MRPDSSLLQDILDSIAEVLDSLPATQAEFDAHKFIRSHILRHIQPYQDLIDRLLYCMAAISDQEAASLEERLTRML